MGRGLLPDKLTSFVIHGFPYEQQYTRGFALRATNVYAALQQGGEMGWGLSRRI